jgi:hypothetical protein
VVVGIVVVVVVEPLSVAASSVSTLGGNVASGDTKPARWASCLYESLVSAYRMWAASRS